MNTQEKAMYANRRLVISVPCASAVALAAAIVFTHPVMAQRHERKLAELEQSAQVRAVDGGVTFQVALSLDKCFDSVINTLRRTGHEIESANKDAGTIVTAMEIAGKYSQTGTRCQVVFMKDSDKLTSVRVAVVVQKRKKLLQTEPWGDPKLDEAQSRKAAADLQEALKAL